MESWTSEQCTKQKRRKKRSLGRRGLVFTESLVIQAHPLPVSETLPPWQLAEPGPLGWRRGGAQWRDPCLRGPDGLRRISDPGRRPLRPNAARLATPCRPSSWRRRRSLEWSIVGVTRHVGVTRRGRQDAALLVFPIEALLEGASGPQDLIRLQGGLGAVQRCQQHSRVGLVRLRCHAKAGGQRPSLGTGRG